MVENESLDVGNRRFRWVVSDILRGKDPAEIADRLIRKLCAAWNYVRSHGFDVLKIVGLAATGGDVARAICDTGGSDFAHLISLHAHPMIFPGAVLDAVNRSAIEQVIDSGFQQALCYEHGPSLLEATEMKRHVLSIAERCIPTLSNSLLHQPDMRLRAPKAVAVAEIEPTLAVTIPMPHALLQQSLLTNSQRASHGVQS